MAQRAHRFDAQRAPGRQPAGLDTVIAGFDWKPGDEAVMGAQDYGAMLDQFTLQARRYGMVNRVVSLPVNPRSDDQIVELYAGAITPKTRLLMVCHMVNITGQILPVAAICEMAHRHGVQVVVDGAHALAHLDFRIPDLGCDYYGASLHKWLGCPLGAGLLWVRKDRIAGLWPLFSDGHADDDIMKLNHTGFLDFLFVYGEALFPRIQKRGLEPSKRSNYVCIHLKEP